MSDNLTNAIAEIKTEYLNSGRFNEKGSHYQNIKMVVEAAEELQSIRADKAPAVDTAVREATLDEVIRTLKDKTCAGKPNGWQSGYVFAVASCIATVEGLKSLATVPTSQPEAGWQDISTAPKDGRKLWLRQNKTAYYGNWYKHSSVEGWVADDLDCNDYVFEPTLWMPADQPYRAPNQTKAEKAS